jgi:hypothetical protein
MARFLMAPFPTALVALAPTDLVAPAPMVMAPAVLSGSHRSLSDGSDGYGYVIYSMHTIVLRYIDINDYWMCEHWYICKLI